MRIASDNRKRTRRACSVVGAERKKGNPATTTSFLRHLALFALVSVSALFQAIPASAQAQQALPQASAVVTLMYPNSSEGLRNLIEGIFRAAKSKDSAKEVELIRGLIIPDDSKWFIDEFGPGFGGSLSGVYRQNSADLEQELRTIFEGDVQRGWIKPKIFRHDNAEDSEFPTDKILNCMSDVQPLYETAVNGTRTGFLSGLAPNGQPKVIAGDPHGYFVFVDGGFRFIPLEMLMKLPKGRPVQIKLDMNVMSSKIINQTWPRVPQEAVQKHVSGKVVIEIIVDVQGNIKDSRVLEGDPILGNSALETVKQWRFLPTRLDGEAVEVDLQVPFEFHVN